MPADDLAAFIGRLRTMLFNGELPRGPLRLGPDPSDQVADVWFYAQMLLDEADEYRAMPKAQREQEPLLSMRRALAQEFRGLQKALA